MTHDYLLHGIGQWPSAYAYRYYTHDPYMGIGNWPPLYYVAEALWMFCFGTDRAAALWLTAFIAALCATLIFTALAEKAGKAVAFGAGLLFLLIPVVQWSNTLIMTDVAVAALSFAAALALARYLDAGRALDAAAFTLLAALAMLTKGSAFFLAAMPPAAVLVSGRLRLFREPSFWLIPFGIAVMVGPWYLYAKRFLAVGWDVVKPAYWQSVAQLGVIVLTHIGWLALLAPVGLWSILRARPVPGIAVVCALQPIAVVLFLALAPTPNEPRYLISALPPLLVLAAYGVTAVVGAVVGKKRRAQLLAPCLMAAIVVAAASVWLFRFDRPRTNEFRSIAEFIVGNTNPVYTAVLVSAEAEGPMIAEITERDPLRGTRFLIRPGKLFAHMNLFGEQYAAKYHSPAEEQTVIESLPISLVIVRRNPPADAAPHERMLRDAIHQFPDRWRGVRSFGSGDRIYDLFAPAHTSEMSGQQLEAFLMDLLKGTFHPKP